MPWPWASVRLEGRHLAKTQLPNRLDDHLAPQNRRAASSTSVLVLVVRQCRAMKPEHRRAMKPEHRLRSGSSICSMTDGEQSLQWSRVDGTKTVPGFVA